VTTQPPISSSRRTGPRGRPRLAKTLAYTGKGAQPIWLSREQFTQPNTSGMLSNSGAKAVSKRANFAYVTQVAPTLPAVTPPVGLVNVAGIADRGAASRTSSPLVDLLATIEGNDGNPTHWILSPTAWARLRKLRTGTGDASSLLDLPVLVSSALTAGTGMVVDKSAIVSAVGQVMVAQSEHAYFSSDSIALRCTWRFGQNIVRPERIGKFTVA
jgi:Phage capsid family